MTEKILFVSWYSPESGFIYPVARLCEREEKPRYEFAYIQGVTEAEEYGFEPFFDFPDLQGVYLSDSLFPMFSNRLMPAARPDYRDFVERLGLSPESADPLGVLSRSGGKRATDRLEMFGFPEYDRKAGELLYWFWARGIRHVGHAEERIDWLNAGEQLLCALDIQNPTDPGAVALRIEKPRHQMVGFLPLYLGQEVASLLQAKADFRVVVERINRDPAPRHQRLLCALRAEGKKNFVPFNALRYRPLSSDATSLKQMFFTEF